ncbi:MAG TPA: hypothetical protein ENH82_09285 [bacterium]|nr:hypothetical protein [bacterium]
MTVKQTLNQEPTTETQLTQAEDKIKDAWKSAGLPTDGILQSSGLSKMSIHSPIKYGAKLRDEVFIQYPLLPQSIFIYQQIVAAREWALGGTPDAVFRCLDFIGNARCTNRATGFIEYGFEGFLRRRVLDHLLIGKTVFAMDTFAGKEYLSYIDPIALILDRQKKIVSKKGYVLPIGPKEKAWLYDGRRYSTENLMISHPLPIGSNRYTAPVSWLVPTANLAWLLREHNSAALDGRKIREILLVSNPSFKTSIEEGLIKLAQLWNGADVTEIGIPVIEITNMGGVPLKDLFAMIGISSIPESLSQERFMFQYANEISGTVGIALRHFWNDDRNTNRALEEVQESRQQQKGPSSFIRSEQRLINNSGFLQRITGSDVRFGFIEESDLVSLQTKAEVLKAYGEAALSFKEVFGASLSMESFMVWMKRIGALPLDIELTEEEEESSDNGDEIAVKGEEELLQEGDKGLSGDAEVISMEKTEKNLDNGHVIVDQNGHIIGKRMKIFSLPSIASLVSEQELKKKTDRLKKLEKAFEEAIAYSDGKESEKVEKVIDYQLYLMAREHLGKLNEVKNLTGEDRDQVTILLQKMSFNISLSSDEMDEIDKLCNIYEVSAIDLPLENEIQ